MLHLHLRNYFYNIIFKIQQKLHTTSGLDPPPTTTTTSDKILCVHMLDIVCYVNCYNTQKEKKITTKYFIENTEHFKDKTTWDCGQ